MNFRTTVILFVIVVAGLIFFMVANRGGTAEQTGDGSALTDPQQGRKLLDVNADDVRKLVIKPAEGRPLELVKGEGAAEWKIVQPAAWGADNFDARNLVESVVNVRSRGRVEEGAGSRADFGLEKPRYTIEVTDKNNKTTTLLVGNQTALGNDLYVDASDGKGTSIVAGGELTGRLQKGTQKMFEALRDKRLVTAPATDVKQLEVTKKGAPKLVLRRDGADWKVVEPKPVDADEAEVSSLLSVVTGLRAEEFVAADSIEASGAMVDQPRVAVWFSSDAPATQPATTPATGPATRPSGTTVAFGQYADVEREKVYVKVAPEPGVLAKVSVSEWQWDRLAQASPVTLRDRKVLDVEAERVEKVTIAIDRAATTQPTARAAEKREVTLERRREPATQKAADAGKDVAAQGEAVLAAAGAKVEAPKAEAPKADAPAGETAAKGEAPAEPAAAKQAAPATGTAPATTTAPTTTAPATAPAAPPSKWVQTSEPKGDANDATVDSLLQGLHPLRATKYLESAPTTPVTGTYTLKVHTNAYGDQPAAVHELRLTETGAGSDAKVIGYHKDLIFELDRFFLDRLTADFTKKSEPQPGSPGLPGIS
jgi:hypothetical protein